MGEVVVGIDVGTTKICTLVGEVRAEDIYVIGVGVEPSRGMKKGLVTDVTALTNAISASVHKAERSSRYEIGRAFVSVAGGHIDARNSRGVVGIAGKNGVQITDLERVLDAARAIPLPHNREVLHVIPRTYTLDGQNGIRDPRGMHGFRLEVEAHIIMAATSSLQNIEKCVQASGVSVDRFILNPLASADVVLTAAERDMGAIVIDIGGGTTDLAVFLNGSVWHTAVIPVGGWHVTNDIATGLHLPYDDAERAKLDYGHADPRSIEPGEQIVVQPFGEESLSSTSRADLSHIIQARVEELFELARDELKNSGAHAGMLSAGVVLTGGCSQLPGIKTVAANVFKLPVRVAQPEHLSGMADQLRSPSFSTSVGLLRMGLLMDQEEAQRSVVATRGDDHSGSNRAAAIGKLVGGFMKRLLPEDEK
ncbi:MAG: cell division protein FtsA [Aggregatilineales bacterium]